MSHVIALIPARSGSKGIRGKNWRALGGRTLIDHAAECALAAGIERAYISTDHPTFLGILRETGRPCTEVIRRPASLAQDDTPMYDVVKHAAETLKLADDTIVVLLQPTQPFRTPEHVTTAVQMLKETGADSVVSVVPLPLTHCSSLSLQVHEGVLYPSLCRFPRSRDVVPWLLRPTRRQDAKPEYKPDGTVYAFWVKTLQSGTLYGADVRPLILDPSETCELDTEADWRAVEARWQQECA